MSFSTLKCKGSVADFVKQTVSRIEKFDFATCSDTVMDNICSHSAFDDIESEGDEKATELIRECAVDCLQKILKGIDKEDVGVIKVGQYTALVANDNKHDLEFAFEVLKDLRFVKECS